MNAHRIVTRIALRRSCACSSAARSGAFRWYSAPAYQPYPLFPNAPPPPRNEAIPESSIALPGALPKVNETRPPRTQSEAAGSASAEAEQISEREAQVSKPVSHPPSNSTSTSTSTSTLASAPSPTSASISTQASASTATAPATPRQRPKLRARKAAVKLTPAAVLQLRALLDQPDPKLIKVGVRNRGCSGLSYSLEYVDKPGAFDEEVVQDGVKVLVDSKALFSIIGSEMDWVEDKLNQRFVFKNPNIKEECGCGESFMV